MENEEIDYIDELITELETRKHNVEQGIINGIPFAIPEIKKTLPSTERGSYILYTGQSKSGKTQCCYYQQLFHTVLYHYDHQDEFDLKIIMFPLEEGRKKTVGRFICYLLYRLYGIRISYQYLRSSNSDYPLPSLILNLIKGEKIQSILKHFKSHVQFETANNPIGISKIIENYANTHGKKHYKPETFEDENGRIQHPLDYYEPNNPKEYVFIILDHFNLIEPTIKDNYKQTEAINHLSNKFVKYYKDYNYVIIAVQQQVDLETSSLDAIKADNILPTKAGLKESKTPGQDATLLLGTCNPCVIRNRDNWEGYKFNDFDRRYFRVFSIIVSRDSEDQLHVPMYFDGAINEFVPLPPANDTAKLAKFKELVHRNRQYVIYIPPELRNDTQRVTLNKPKISLPLLFKKHKNH